VAKQRHSQLKALKDGNGASRLMETEEVLLPQAEFLSALLRGYRGKPYPGRTLLIRTVSGPSSFAWEMGSTNGWREVLLGELAVEEISCGHLDISREPYVSIVARKLECYLSQSDADLATEPLPLIGEACPRDFSQDVKRG
jgi:hypothetical protein